MTSSPDPRLDPDVLTREGLSEQTVAAVGKLSEAFETVEAARGHLYQFHRLSGRADLLAGEAVEELREAGHADLADRLDRELIGLNVLAGRWTFQIVEEYDDGYYATFRGFDEESLGLVNGHRHLFEAGLKRERRTEGRAGHEADPSQV
ncbi:hypothetical protein [Nocardioides sp.]|uniref:hypothetical protein n=1 Tax=Nocardioides sp. TaxID=35761 RepID=UPI0035114710